MLLIGLELSALNPHLSGLRFCRNPMCASKTAGRARISEDI